MGCSSLYIWFTNNIIQHNLTICSHDVDVVLPVESLGVENSPVLLCGGVIEHPGVVVVTVLVLTPHSTNGHGVTECFCHK